MEARSAKKETIVKLSNVLNVLMKIGEVTAVLAIVGGIVAVIVAPSIDFGAVTLKTIWGDSVNVNSVAEFRLRVCGEMLSLAVIAAIMFVASYIFKDMTTQHTPFAQKNADRLKIISLLLIGFTIVVQPLKAFLIMVFVPGVNEFTFHINLAHFVFAAVFFCLALIFEYGVILQQESDETL
ncbi:MAG: DUF2975 domain-containing protein [Oscillospiraceae bacterium]|nr:DUF2975 domain-containing protein [Oscillospiraceae bacterium]